MDLVSMVLILCASGHECDAAARAYAKTPAGSIQVKNLERKVKNLAPVVVHIAPTASALARRKFNLKVFGPIRFEHDNGTSKLFVRYAF